jgi:hypothetical protein
VRRKKNIVSNLSTKSDVFQSVCVVCVAAEPPPSSGYSVGDAGAAALAAALEKNTSLRQLDLRGEFFCVTFD